LNHWLCAGGWYEVEPLVMCRWLVWGWTIGDVQVVGMRLNQRWCAAAWYGGWTGNGGLVVSVSDKPADVVDVVYVNM
jgi:hypothetical protein